jgi:hypothetical protein
MIAYIIGQVIQRGEKYEMNLEIIGDLALRVEPSESLSEIVRLLEDKGGEALLKNISLIK